MPELHSNTIHIAIADNHDMVREGVCSLLSCCANFSIDITAHNEEELLNKLSIAAGPPDVCILALNSFPQKCSDTLITLKQKWPEVKVLILSISVCNEYVRKILHAGANGYIAKSFTSKELINAILKIHENDFYFPDSVSRIIYNAAKNEKSTRLTENELKFLTHCCSDLSYKEIAKLMSLSPRTVEGYRNALFEKLNLKTRVGLVIYAVRSGLVPLYDI